MFWCLVLYREINLVFRLLQPLRSRFSGPSHSNESTNPEQICSHKAECYEFNKKVNQMHISLWFTNKFTSACYQELKLYSNVAIAIELVRNTIKYFKYLKSRPLRGIAKIIRSINLKFILFAVGYPSSYRVTSTTYYILIQWQMCNFLIKNHSFADTNLFVQWIQWMWNGIRQHCVSIFIGNIFLRISKYSHICTCTRLYHWNPVAAPSSVEAHIKFNGSSEN